MERNVWDEKYLRMSVASSMLFLIFCSDCFFSCLVIFLIQAAAVRFTSQLAHLGVEIGNLSNKFKRYFTFKELCYSYTKIEACFTRSKSLAAAKP